MTKYLLTLLIFFVILIFGLANYFIKPGFNKKTAKIKIGSAVFQIEIADSFLERQKGLSNRKNLGESKGMLFVFPIAANYGFWMKEMNFPIDIIWIKDDRIIGISENLAPDNLKPLKVYYPPKNIDKALEILAGAAMKKGIKIGDRVEIKK